MFVYYHNSHRKLNQEVLVELVTALEMLNKTKSLTQAWRLELNLSEPWEPRARFALVWETLQVGGFQPNTRACFHFLLLLLSWTSVFAHTVLCLAPGGTSQAMWKAASVSLFILIAKCEGIAIHVIPGPEFCLWISLYIKSTAVHKPLLVLPVAPAPSLESLFQSPSYL